MGWKERWAESNANHRKNMQKELNLNKRAKMVAFDGLNLVAKAVEKGLIRLANARRELLDEQYKTIAIALLEESIIRLNCIASGSTISSGDPLCMYYCSKNGPNCIDPHSKFACPVYAVTGLPLCQARPVYPERLRDMTNNTGKSDADFIEAQIEFLSEIVFGLDPRKRFSLVHRLHDFQIDDLCAVWDFDYLKQLPGVRYYQGETHLVMRGYDNKETLENSYWVGSLLASKNWRSDIKDSVLIVTNISDDTLGVKCSPEGTTYHIPIWSVYKVF